MFTKDAIEVNVMDDNRTTKCREVWCNGILAINMKEYVIPFARLGNGEPANLLPWGSFPDNPNNQ